MNISPARLIHHARSDAGRRAIRYSATSAIGVAISQVLLWWFQSFWKPTLANLVASVITAVPAFILNKYWVWGKRGRAHLRREVIPFWAFTVAGWALSTGMVAVVDNATRTELAGGGYEHNKLAVGVAAIAGFGILWVLKYLFLDKIMFGAHHHTPYDEDIELEEQVAEEGEALAEAHGAVLPDASG